MLVARCVMFLWNGRGGGSRVRWKKKTYIRSLLYISCHFISGHFVKRPWNARVTFAEELDTMSKNNLRAIPLGIRPIWGSGFSFLPFILFCWYSTHCSHHTLQEKEVCFWGVKLFHEIPREISDLYIYSKNVCALRFVN